MKKVLLTVAAATLMLSCGQDVTIQDSEALRVEAFNSVEFKSLQESYSTFVDIEASAEQLFSSEETAKLTEVEIEKRKNEFVEKVSQKLFEATKKRDAFLKKYPSVSETMSLGELRDVLRANAINE